MKVAAQLIGADAEIVRLRRAPEVMRREWASELFAIGKRAVTLMKAARAQMPRPKDPSQTFARRSGNLIRSYDHRVEEARQGIYLTVGAIKPTDAGRVPIQARVHEGFTAAGNKTSLWVIRPRNKAWLVFPIRQGGGLAKSNIVSWVKTKRVTFKPTPVVGPVGEQIPAAIQDRCGKAFADAFQVG